MREVLLYLLPCVYAFLACIGFSMLFNIHGAGSRIPLWMFGLLY